MRLLLLTAWLLLLAAFSAAGAEKRVALVIFNSATPASSSEAVAAEAGKLSTELQRAGFTVTSLQDAGLDRMRAALRDFLIALDGADGGTGLVYLAGAAADAGGSSYFLPAGEPLGKPAEITAKGQALTAIAGSLAWTTARKYIVVDAQWMRMDGVAAPAAASMTVPENTVVSLLATPAKGPPSPFMEAFVQALADHGSDLEEVLQAARLKVATQGAGAVAPLLLGDIVPAALPEPSAAAPAAPSAEDAAVRAFREQAIAQQKAFEEVRQRELARMAALERALAAAPAPPPAALKPKVLARLVQTELARLGCYRRDIDGDWGPGSRRALRDYYASRSEEPASLQPDFALLARLSGDFNPACGRVRRGSAGPKPAEPAVSAEAPPADSDTTVGGAFNSDVITGWGGFDGAASPPAEAPAPQEAEGAVAAAPLPEPPMDITVGGAMPGGLYEEVPAYDFEPGAGGSSGSGGELAGAAPEGPPEPIVPGGAALPADPMGGAAPFDPSATAEPPFLPAEDELANTEAPFELPAPSAPEPLPVPPPPPPTGGAPSPPLVADAMPRPPPPAEPAPPVDSEEAIVRHPTIEAPEEVVAAETFTVSVALTEEQLTPEATARAAPTTTLTPEGALAFSLPGAEDWPIDIDLLAAGFELADNGKWSRRVMLYRDGDSDFARFELKARPIKDPAKPRQVMARFYHDGRFLGSASRPITVLRAVPEAEAAEAAAATLIGSPTEPIKAAATQLVLNSGSDADLVDVPDLDVTVHYDDPDRLGRGLIVLHSRHLNGPVSTEFETPGGMTEWLNGEYKRLVNLGLKMRGARSLAEPAALDEASQRGFNQKAAEGFGDDLYRHHVPQAFKDVFWKLKGRGVLKSIQITSNSPVLPWELVRPRKTEEAPADGFLGISYRVARWAPRAAPAQVDQPLARMAYTGVVAVAPSYESDQELPFQKTDMSALSKLEGFRMIEGDFSAFERMVGEVSTGFIHFSGHGEVNDNGSGSPVFAIRLADQLLDPTTWRALTFAPHDKGNPFYFFNACDTGRAASLGGFVQGWGPAVLASGASGFIGGMWPLTDQTAASFSTEFYGTVDRGLASGPVYVADVLRSVRQRFYETGDPTYLAYTFYGNANLKVVAGEPQ